MDIRAHVKVVEGADEDGTYADLHFPENTPRGPWLVDFAATVLDRSTLETVRNVTTGRNNPDLADGLTVRIGFTANSLFTPENEDFTAALSRIGNATLGIHLDFDVQPRQEATV